MDNELTELEKLEQATFEEDDSTELPPNDIVAYNELRSCADLFRMYKDGILDIHPSFQRKIVWKNPDQTRFIDSLVKQLPIPSMCFSLDYKAQKWQVIDGLQRMWTIIRFLSGSDWTLSELDDVDTNLSGNSISVFVDKNSRLHSYFTRIENLSLPVTVLRCDYQKKSHSEYMFMIFHRLNTGGTKLNNQEIRNCIYSGPFNDFLKEMDSNKSWMIINKMASPGDFRYTKQELILRLIAFNDSYKNYKGRLAKFLNDYMHEHRYADEKYLEQKRAIFKSTINLLYASVFAGKIPDNLSIAVLESSLVGISLNLAFLESKTQQYVQTLYSTLRRQNEFSEEKLSEGLAGREKLIARMDIAARVFSGK